MKTNKELAEELIKEQTITQLICRECGKAYDKLYECSDCQEQKCEDCGDFRLFYSLCMEDNDTNENGEYECGQVVEGENHTPSEYLCKYCQ